MIGRYANLAWDANIHPLCRQIEFSTVPGGVANADALEKYIRHGFRPPPGLLTDVLKNCEELPAADEENTKLMIRLAFWISDNLPEQCHGTEHKFNRWISVSGLSGLDIETGLPCDPR